MALPLNRRQAAMSLLGGAGLVGVIGAWQLLRLDDQDLARAMLERLVGPFRMSPTDLTGFTSDYSARYGMPSRIKASLLTTAEQTGTWRLLDHAPRGISEDFERFERTLLTEFITKTDFLAIDPAQQPVSYLGSTPCASPFANFDAA